jgi:hypothetical protein
MVRPRSADTRDPYRLFMEYTPSSRSLDLILRDASEWLQERQVDVDVRRTGRGGHDSCRILTTWHEAGSSRNFRLQMHEVNSSGKWNSDLVVSESRDRGWVNFAVSSEQGRFVAVPRLASKYMDLLDGTHGPVPLMSSPTVVRSTSLDDLIELICDPERSIPLLVAGTNQDREISFESFVDRYSRWTKQVRGLAGVLVMDPLATEALVEAFGDSYSVPAWTIRTFLPDVDPASEPDALRHRILGTARLAGSERAVQYLLGDITRRYAASRPVPGEVVSTTRTLNRVADKALLAERVAEATVAPAAPAEPAPPRAPSTPTEVPTDRESKLAASLELVRLHLGLEEITPDSLAEIARDIRFGREILEAETTSLDLLRSSLEEAEEERDYWRDLLGEEQLELAVAEETRARLEDEVRFLRVQLQRVAPAAAWIPVDEASKTHYPRDFGELLKMWSTSPLVTPVKFTGDPDLALDLDALDDLGVFSRTTWECLLALSDYLKVKSNGFAGGFEDYVHNTPADCRSIGPKKHVRGETAATMKRFGAERVFPVPDTVDPSGKTVMQAHFRLGRAGMSSPRMYYFDAFHIDGHAYVGYIGPHLTNTQTN